MAQHLGTSSRGPSAGDMQDPRWAIKVCNRALLLQHSPLHMSVLKERALLNVVAPLLTCFLKINFILNCVVKFPWQGMGNLH